MNDTISATVGPLTAADLDAVVAIDQASAGTSRRGYFERRLRAATERPGDYVYVACRSGGALVGFALARVTEGEFGTGASAALDAIGVDPAHRGRGYGRALMAEVEKVLRHKGVAEMTSQVDWQDGALLGFLRNAGFELDGRLVLVRPTDEIPPDEPELPDDAVEIDHSAPDSDDFTALARDRVPVHSMREADLDAVIRIDRRVTGRDRRAYFERLHNIAQRGSGVRLSLVAELNGDAAGFIMARVDFGEFGHTAAEAVMDTLGVDPGYQGRGAGQALMSQLMANLGALQVETVRTVIDWDDVNLAGYLSAVGFRPSQRLALWRRV